MAHPSPLFVGDRLRRAWLPQACHLREIDDAIRGSPKPASRHHGSSSLFKARSAIPWSRGSSSVISARSAVPRSRGSCSLISSRSAIPRSRGSSPHVTTRSAILSLVLPSGTVLIYLVGHIHGDSSGASLSRKERRLLRDLARAPDSSSCTEEASASKPSPGGLPVPVGCPVLSGLSNPVGCPVLSCPVCLVPEGSWLPLAAPWIFFAESSRIPAVVAGPREQRLRQWRLPAIASDLSVPLWRPRPVSCSCVSWGASRLPTPPPWWNCYGASCVSCVPASCFHICFFSCPC